MDEILYLELDEEITSVIDKIKNLPGMRVGLVVPREATLLQSVVNLRLLAKEANALGKEIAIVTADRIGRNLAAQVGLTVYNSIQEQTPAFTPPPPIPNPREVIELDLSPESEEKPPEGVSIHHFQEARRYQPPARPQPAFRPEPQPAAKSLSPKELDPRLKKLLWPIVAILAVLAAIAAFLLWPKALVTLAVPSEDLKKEVKVLMSNKITQADIQQSVFPATLIEAEKESSQKFAATGKKNIGEKTKGTITVYNAWESSARKFSAGTKFSSSSKVFLAINDFTVPGSAIREGNLVPGSVSVQIEAEKPGEEYNIKAGRFTILGLPSAQQEKIYGSSSGDFSGGYAKEVQVVSQTDYDNGKKTLQDKLTAEVDQEMRTQAQGQKMLDKAVITPEPEITTSSKVDEEAKEFEMKLKLKKQAMVFNFANYREFLTQILAKQVPSDKMVAIANDEDIGAMVQNTAFDKGEMEMTNNVAAKIAAKISADKIKTDILGKGKGEADKYLKSQEGVSAAEIRFSPSWWPKIPILSRNLTVQIKYLTE